MTEFVSPDALCVDETNERTSVDTDSESFQQLVESIEEAGGPIESPVVRPTDRDGAQYSVVTGQRRVRASQAAGIDTIAVTVYDWDDTEARIASITENIELFKSEVSTMDRAEALQQLWESMDGGGVPSNAVLASKLGVPRTTVRTWLEPLHGDWSTTSLDPTSTSTDSDSDSDSANDSDDEITPEDAADELGERTMAEVRRMTGGGETGAEVLTEAAKNDLTQSDVKDARDIVEETDANPYEAIEQLAEDEPETDSDTDSDTDTDTDTDTDHLSDTATSDDGDTVVDVEFDIDAEMQSALDQYATNTDQSVAEVTAEAFEWFLEREVPSYPPSSDTDSKAGSSPSDSGGKDGENTDAEHTLITRTADEMLSQ